VEQTTKRLAGIAGVIAAGLALGLGELLAGLFDAVPSPLASVGGLVVDSSPRWVKETAIELFGTADKGALAIGTGIVSLLIGWFVGGAARKRFWVAAVVFGGFGAFGAWAGRNEPDAVIWAIIGAALVTVGAALVTLWVLLGNIPEPTDVDATETVAGDVGRRRFLVLAGLGGAAAVGAGAAGRVLLASLPEPPPAPVQAGAGTTAVGSEHSFTVDGLTPVVVPNGDFYRIDTALVVPRVEPETWSLRIHGRVDDELVLTYEDLLAHELVEDHVTLSCVSNRVGGDLVGNALWSGVRLEEVLAEAGVDRDGTQLVGRSVDGWTAGFPTEAAFEGRGALIALGMNGEVLPRVHGFPARLVVPGLYGYVSATKWLSEIEITGWDDFDAYWIPRGWAKEAPIKTQSRIDVPRNGRPIAAEDGVVAAGVAWAPYRGISRVEVRLDGGDWTEAELSEPLSQNAWVQWRAELDAGPGEHTLSVRATDGEGVTQTAEEAPPAPDGATGHHTIRFRVE
jgi:DMSO/TMAO reductase YedYZ molybdopterin-dependent catalytic subunit